MIGSSMIAWLQSKLVPGLGLALAVVLGLAVLQYVRAERLGRALEEERGRVVSLNAQIDGFEAANDDLAVRLANQSLAVRTAADSARRAALQDRIDLAARMNRALDAYARARRAGDAEADRVLASDVGPSCEAALAYLRDQAPRLLE